MPENQTPEPYFNPEHTTQQWYDKLKADLTLKEDERSIIGQVIMAHEIQGESWQTPVISLPAARPASMVARLFGRMVGKPKAVNFDQQNRVAQGMLDQARQLRHELSPHARQIFDEISGPRTRVIVAHHQSAELSSRPVSPRTL